jgi:hypothetical protein
LEKQPGGQEPSYSDHKLLKLGVLQRLKKFPHVGPQGDQQWLQKRLL